ncbi:MAG TPA: XdhC family protein [Methylomirabilota bacterium]|jgi:xanthine dehydrogenase accessory factor|nr:XdhC family protein [Methylomirabilota bacterium]
MKRALLDRLLAERGANRPTALVTSLNGDGQSLVTAEETHGDLGLPLSVIAAARTALRSDRSGPVEADGGRYFIRVYNPPLRMAVIGAVHIAQALGPMAALAGYEVTVIDPRQAFATEARFPGVRLVPDWPDEALGALRPDRRTAVVTLTHDPKLDDPALEVALRSDAFYIGALGSTRTQAKRLHRLQELGFNQEQLGRIHGPIGLKLGGRAPAEIAIAILAEATQVLHRGEAAEAEAAS